ncbi:hypothetical protein [Neisseria sp. Marseille-Q2251]|uniref:hypothetical protein n=1 Tax=Neisseria sp. Marseille-Q2251 TaxID=2866585 RepID=UPI003138E709
MSVKAIYEKLTQLPTIIGLDNEVLLIEELQKSEIEDIRQNLDNFLSILDDLQISHQSDGIFGVTPENKHIFFGFVFWLQSVQNKIGMDISRYADGFDTDFSCNLTI